MDTNDEPIEFIYRRVQRRNNTKQQAEKIYILSPKLRKTSPQVVEIQKTTTCQILQHGTSAFQNYVELHI